MHRLLILLPLLALTACATVGAGTVHIPGRAVVDWIEHLPYVPGEFDCSAKAALLVDYYHRHKLPALVVIVPAPRLLRYSHALLLPHHAVVAVKADGGWVLVDPTNRHNVDGLPAPVDLPFMGEAALAQELAWAVEYLHSIGLEPPR